VASVILGSVGVRFLRISALVVLCAVVAVVAAQDALSLGQVPPSWPTYRDARRGFELRLPPGWKAGTTFLQTHAFAVLRRRNPRLARQYEKMLRAAPRSSVWFVAVDTSSFALSHSLTRDGGSYGLFPTIFVMPESRVKKAYAGAATAVVPEDWRGRTPDTNRSDCDANFKRHPICLDVYQTFRGDLYLDLWHVMARPSGRVALVAGYARGQNIDQSGALLSQPSQAVWEAARELVRYT
jgi:hypothetical protein